MTTTTRKLSAGRAGDASGRCPGCGSARIIRDYRQGASVCSGCGLVVRDRVMDFGPEWRAFDHEQWEGRCRVGPPSTPAIHDKGLSTTIDWRNRDSQGKSLTPKRRAQVYRLRKWQHRIRISNAAERSLAFAFSEIYRMSSSLSLPQNVREIAAVIYPAALFLNMPKCKILAYFWQRRCLNSA